MQQSRVKYGVQYTKKLGAHHVITWYSRKLHEQNKLLVSDSEAVLGNNCSRSTQKFAQKAY